MSKIVMMTDIINMQTELKLLSSNHAKNFQLAVPSYILCHHSSVIIAMNIIISIMKHASTRTWPHHIAEQTLLPCAIRK